MRTFGGGFGGTLYSMSVGVTWDYGGFYWDIRGFRVSHCTTGPLVGTMEVLSASLYYEFDRWVLEILGFYWDIGGSGVLPCTMGSLVGSIDAFWVTMHCWAFD